MARSSYVLLLVTLLLAGLFASSFALPPQTGIHGGCGMSWMTPHYVHMDLTKQHSRLAGKYKLYLYREYGWDTNDIDGVPVLFAPGNAGSFRQIRSIASSAARQYRNETGQTLGEFGVHAGARHLDFFAVDFNEDFSALHGTTLLEQSEYLNDAVRFILSLYKRQPSPTAVIMLAHSMGGISARKMLTMPNYLARSVNTIITLSTPHLVPPATFDSTIETIYEDIDHFWRAGHASIDSTHPLKDVLLVSISGGAADTMISSDATSLAGVVPPSHGFTVFTTSVPGLYAPVDHQAMMWCDQLRAAVARALLEMVDDRVAGQMRSLEQRNAIMRDFLLSNGSKRVAETPTGESMELRLVDGRLNFHHAQPDTLYAITLPTLADTQSVHVLAEPDHLDLWSCSGTDSDSCTSVIAGIEGLPRSRPGLPTSNSNPLQSYLLLPSSHRARQLRLRFSGQQAASLFVETAASFHADRTISQSLYAALFGFSIPLAATLRTHLVLPSLDSSLLVYKATLHHTPASTSFAPLLRAAASHMHESHYYPDFSTASVFIHGEAPFILSPGATTGGLQLDLWRDPSDANADDYLSIRIDVLASLGKVVLRYRTVFAAWPLVISLLVLQCQLRVQSRGSHFVSFGRAFTLTLRDLAVPISLALTIGGVVQALVLPRLRHPVTTWLSGALLGNTHPIFALLPITLLAGSGGFFLVIALALQAIVWLLAKLLMLVWSRLSRANRDADTSSTRQRIIFLLSLTALVTFFAPIQFAFLMLTLMHLFTTVSSLVTAQTSPLALSRQAANRHAYHFATFLILFTLLPLTAPILIVWSRNLLAGWYAPFSSDRNPLRILGFLLWTDAIHHGGHDLPSPSLSRWTQAAIVATTIYVLLYGIRYAYIALPFVNGVFLLLALQHYASEPKAATK